MNEQIILDLENLNIQDFLGNLWFEGKNPNDPVFLNLEEEILLQLGISGEVFQKNLVDVVLRSIDFDKPSDLFHTFYRRLARWRAGGSIGHPPILCVLALTVLAAKQMGNDGTLSSHAYYPRLARLLGKPELAAALSSSFDSVVEMWKAVHEWIEGNPLLGRSMISTLGGYPRIGYPRSQALVTLKDNIKLSKLKNKIGEIDFHKLSDDQILLELRNWSTTSSRFSLAFEQILQIHGAELQTYLIFAARSIRGDYASLEKRNKKEFAAELWYEFDTNEFNWVLPKNKLLSDFQGVNNDGHILQVSDGYLSEIHETKGFPKPSFSTLRQSISWHQGDISVSIGPRSHWILTEAEAADSLISRTGPPATEPFSILLPANREDELSQLLEDHLEPSQVAYDIISGWNFYVDVRSRLNSTSLVESLDLDPLRDLSSTKIDRVSLSGGIQVRARSGKTAYIQGYEPDLIVESNAPTFTLEIGVTDLVQTLKNSGNAFPLSKIHLPLGETTLTISAESRKTIKIISLEESWEYSDFYIRLNEEIELFNSNERIANRNRFYFSVHKDGSIAELSHAGQPFWLVRRGIKSDFQNFLLEIPDDCIWLVALHDRNPPIVETISEQLVCINADEIRACKATWEAFFALNRDVEIPNLNSLILMVKALI